MRRDVQDIFRMTPRTKQVMMFSATMSKEIRPVCRNFMQDVRWWWRARDVDGKKNRETRRPPTDQQLH